MSKTVHKSFIEKYNKIHSICPGVGAYNPDKSLDKAVRRSLFLRSHRHWTKFCIIVDLQSSRKKFKCEQWFC